MDVRGWGEAVPEAAGLSWGGLTSECDEPDWLLALNARWSVALCALSRSSSKWGSREGLTAPMKGDWWERLAKLRRVEM